MFQSISRTRLIAMWLGAVALIAAAVMMVDGGLPLRHVPLLLALCLTPPTILLIVWRGAQAPTVADVPYAANHDKGGRV